MRIFVLTALGMIGLQNLDGYLCVTISLKFVKEVRMRRVKSCVVLHFRHGLDGEDIFEVRSRLRIEQVLNSRLRIEQDSGKHITDKPIRRDVLSVTWEDISIPNRVKCQMACRKGWSYNWHFFRYINLTSSTTFGKITSCNLSGPIPDKFKGIALLYLYWAK